MSTQRTRNPAIVAPVSRQLSVADVDRSIAFYRDVLGFDVRRIAHGDNIMRDPDGHTLWFAQSFQQPDACGRSRC